MNLSLRKQEIIWGYMFVTPWVIGAAVLLIWPLLRSLLLSLENVTDLINLQTEWVGWQTTLRPSEKMSDFCQDCSAACRIWQSICRSS